MTDSITRFCGCYKSKSSAARAMRSWVGNQIEVSWEGVSNRFETTAILREGMMAVTQLQGGWGVSISYTKDDLLCVIMGDDGFPKDVPYAEVAHWADATHPPIPTIPPVVNGRAYRVEAMSLDIAANKISRFIPLGEVNSTWEAIMKVFYPGGQPANNLPFGSYRVTVYIDGMSRSEVSTYRFN